MSSLAERTVNGPAHLEGIEIGVPDAAYIAVLPPVDGTCDLVISMNVPAWGSKGHKRFRELQTLFPNLLHWEYDAEGHLTYTRSQRAPAELSSGALGGYLEDLKIPEVLTLLNDVNAASAHSEPGQIVG